MAVAKMSEFRTSLIGAFLVALGPISMALYTPAMPELVKAFSTTDSAIKLSLSLYFAGYALAQLVSGTVSDALGRRKTTMIFMSIYLIGSVLAAFAPTVNILLVGRLIQGIGSSVGMTVSRALVRDQFTGHTAARIMNMIAIMLAIGPAIAPTIGGFSLALFGWQSVFFLMVGFAVIACLVAYFLMVETIEPDLGRLKPGPVISAYRELLSDSRFVSAIFVVGGAVGALYTQATILPFVLIDKVGLTPTQFGVGMLMQSGFFLTGSLVVQQLLQRFQAAKLVIPGLVLVAIASVALALSIQLLPLSFLSVMVPVAIYAFGIAFILPSMMTSAMAPFPHIAGSAAALMGFVQMGSGVVGGVIAAAIGIPVLSMGTVIPGFGAVCVMSYFLYRAAMARNPLPPVSRGFS